MERKQEGNNDILALYKKTICFNWTVFMIVVLVEAIVDSSSESSKLVRRF